ncbi:MAG: hypothetical protein EOO01_21175 [Chitinophagaceae bacterium]|nr:MAG: hypothetical protein EOO01_21175 [Chitinophagaceae bacterium]
MALFKKDYSMILDSLNHLAWRMNRKIEWAFFILAAVYFIGAMIIFLPRPASGDELVFISDLDYTFKHGFWAASRYQVSLPYMLLVYPFATFLEPIVALRLVNLLLTAFLFLYIIKISKQRIDVLFYSLFFIATANFFFAGVNDVLFITGMVLFLSETMLHLDRGENTHSGLGLFGLVIAIFTRQLYLLYLIPILVGLFYLLNYYWRPSRTWLVICGLTLAFFVYLNIPSIETNHKLSYDNKVPPPYISANWQQLQYLAQLEVNAGDRPNYTHPSWEDVDSYLNMNGDYSLPDNTFDALTMDPILTFTEFFKDLGDSLFFSTRGIGLMLWFALFFGVRGILSTHSYGFELLIPFTLVWVMCLVSFIIISFIEARWYAAILLTVCMFFSRRAREEKYSHLLLAANYSGLLIMTIYGMYKWTLR